MSNNAFWATVNGLILAFLLALIVGVTWIVCRHGEKMAELGYQEEILPGSSMSYWRKCK